MMKRAIVGAALLLAGCASDPSVIRYGEMACYKNAVGTVTHCASVRTLSSERRVERKFGKE